MKIKLVVVGKIKEQELQKLMNEYLKQMKKYCTMEIIELADESNKLDKNKVLEKEGHKIIEQLDDDYYKVLLDIHGKQITSIQLKELMEDNSIYKGGQIIFVIGGSYGVSELVKTKIDYKLSFSKMTFPHQLFRLMLIEQIYRAFKIMKNEPYHK